MSKLGRFGFEIELYTPDYESTCRGDCAFCEGCNTMFEEVMDDYSSIGLRELIFDIKDDGSLNSNGYEINSTVHAGFNSLEKNLLKIVNGAKKLGHYSESPCAIHLHASDLYKPLGFYYEAFKWELIYTSMLNQVGFNLINSLTRIEDIPHIDNMILANKRLTTRVGYRGTDFTQITTDSQLSGNRTRIIRNRIHTLEFRPFPARLNKEYIKLVLRIYKKMINIGNRRGLIESYYQCLANKKLGLDIQLKRFKEVFNLSNYEIFLFANKDNPTNRERFKLIESEGGAPIDYFRLIPPSEYIDHDISYLRQYAGSTVDSGYSLPILDESNEVHRIMHNLLASRRGYNLADSSFRFSQTRIDEIYAFCSTIDPIRFPRL